MKVCVCVNEMGCLIPLQIYDASGGKMKLLLAQPCVQDMEWAGGDYLSERTVVAWTAVSPPLLCAHPFPPSLPVYLPPWGPLC